jgi:L-ascorbate metabolism protein UlaG (beta-lactamase superfamily)
MDKNLLYLKPDIALEALVDRWYAWPHLISPATYTLNLKFRHLEIMKSYIENPEIHFKAVSKPEFRGGPFMDFKCEMVEETRELFEETLVKHKDKLEFAEALLELSNILEKEAKGFSLEPLYQKIPAVLKGYVELVYDLSNRASFRLIEPLLYHSKYYDDSSQSISLQQVTADNSRHFILSTPRLNQPETLHLEIPFAHKGIDELYKMRITPGYFSDIKDMFNIRDSQEKLFRSFFTEQPPEKPHKYDGPGIRTRYFGHACILVETKEISILTDPVISYGYDSELCRYSYTDLPDKIDYVLITHNHQDHILLETLLQLRHKIKYIIVPKNSQGNLQDPSLKLMFNNMGFENVIELGEMEKLAMAGCIITGLPFVGEHSDLDIRSKLCYHISFDNYLKIIFAADSCNKVPEVYQHIHKITGDIDILFLGMECDGAPLSWLYGPLMPIIIERDKDHSRRLAGSNFEQAMDYVNCFNPLEVFVYAMGMEPWLEFISSIKYTDESRPIVESNKLIKKCKSIGINAERLYGEKTIEYTKQTILI